MLSQLIQKYLKFIKLTFHLESDRVVGKEDAKAQVSGNWNSWGINANYYPAMPRAYEMLMLDAYVPISIFFPSFLLHISIAYK